MEGGTYRQLRDVVRNQEVPVCTGPVHDEANDLFRCEDAKPTYKSKARNTRMCGYERKLSMDRGYGQWLFFGRQAETGSMVTVRTQVKQYRKPDSTIVANISWLSLRASLRRSWIDDRLYHLRIRIRIRGKARPMHRKYAKVMPLASGQDSAGFKAKRRKKFRRVSRTYQRQSVYDLIRTYEHERKHSQTRTPMSLQLCLGGHGQWTIDKVE